MNDQILCIPNFLDRELHAGFVSDVFFRTSSRPLHLILMILLVFSRTSVKKGKPMKRTKTARKVKAVAKAIAKHDKYEEKASKNVSKIQRTLSAKLLYE